jgi:hypothetical protein
MLVNYLKNGFLENSVIFALPTRLQTVTVAGYYFSFKPLICGFSVVLDLLSCA